MKIKKPLDTIWNYYFYNNSGWLTDLTNWKTSTDVISEFSYTHDDVGNRMSMTTEDGPHDYGRLKGREDVDTFPRVEPGV